MRFPNVLSFHRSTKLTHNTSQISLFTFTTSLVTFYSSNLILSHLLIKRTTQHKSSRFIYIHINLPIYLLLLSSYPITSPYSSSQHISRIYLSHTLRSTPTQTDQRYNLDQPWPISQTLHLLPLSKKWTSNYFFPFFPFYPHLLNCHRTHTPSLFMIFSFI